MFIQGIINSANPGADFYAELATALSSEGLTLVDTVTTFTPRIHKIWQSPSSNIFGTSWYLDVSYEATGAAPVWLNVFEDYNALSDTAHRGPVNYYESWTLDTNGSMGITGYPLEDDHWWNVGYNSASDQPCWIAMLPNEDMGYAATVTKDRVIAMTSHDAQRFTYAGLFKPSSIYTAVAASNAFPLLTGHISNDPYSDDCLLVTRWPGRGGQSPPNDIRPMLPRDNPVSPASLSGVGAREPSGGAYIASEVWFGTYDSSWFGSFYDVAAVPVAAPYDGNSSKGNSYGVGRGDIVKTNTSLGSATPSAEWFLGAPRQWSGWWALMMKKV